jgi:hypothetical protein
MGRILTEKDVEAAVRGGSVYAAGGGGWADHGRKLGYAAVNVGTPELVDIEEVDENDWVATAAAIGAPASTTPWEMQGVDYIKAVQLLQDALGEKVSGLMIGQNGKSSTLNGWLPSAVLGTKVVDAVGDIRAHPTGDMGSIGMAGSPEPMIQTAVGGNREENRYIELVVKGATAKVSPVLRTAADQSGGFIASCRNPLRASYVKRNAALGGISMALKLGEAMIAADGKGPGGSPGRHRQDHRRQHHCQGIRDGVRRHLHQGGFRHRPHRYWRRRQGDHSSRDERVHGGGGRRWNASCDIPGRDHHP